MKKITAQIASLFLLIALFSLNAYADSGVVISATGNVTISNGTNSAPAKTGSKFDDGSTVSVASGGAATLMFSSGVTKNIGSGETYIASNKNAKSETSIIKGLAMAYNDAKNTSSGPTVHGMVKTGHMGKPKIAPSPIQLTPANAKQMKSDLSKIKALDLDKDGETLVKAQIFYKYSQYQKVIDTLLPLYRKQNPPSDTVKEMIALSYEKMGKTELANKFK